MSILVISEKPSSAAKIAEALGAASKKQGYFEVKTSQGNVFVAPAVGHLYTLVEREKSHNYPVFDVEWVEVSKAGESAEYAAKYLAVLKKLAKEASSVIIACDYDVEGELIGYNIHRFLAPKLQAKRMKFSTLTKGELLDAFENLEAVPILKAKAGETRHYLDWFFGINLSRALMSAIKTAGTFRLMSIGRVQGPTLALLAQREKVISIFKPEPYWQVFAEAKEVIFTHEVEKFKEKQPAETVMANANGKEGVIEEVKREKYLLNAPTPYDLTSLQVDAYNAFGFTPAITLQIAQRLYEAAAISYPRTASQQLPEKLNLKKIISELAGFPQFREVANSLLAKPRLVPNNGKKTDPAHPAIHPTGIFPARMGENEAKLYDLIARRFLATFGEAAKREKMQVTLNVNGEKFRAASSRTLSPGWLVGFPYAKMEEVEMDFEQGEKIKPKRVWMEEKETQPPKRYSPASIVKKLEALNIGTKATRAEVIETLYSRNYIEDKKSIRVTALGMAVYSALSEHSKKIMDESLTRKFEGEMEEIENGKTKPEQVMAEGKETVAQICAELKLHEKEIGKKLLTGLNTSIRQATELGKCTCGGVLVLRRSKFGVFVGCNKYPECKVTFPLPHGASIVPIEKVCEKCGTPIVGVARKGKRFFQMCLDTKCETKASWAKSSNGGHKEEGFADRETFGFPPSETKASWAKNTATPGANGEKVQTGNSTAPVKAKVARRPRVKKSVKI